MPLQAVGVRALGERLLDGVQPLATVVDRSALVAADHGADAGVEEDVRHRDTCGADAGRHDRDLLDALADDAERVEEGGEDDDRGAMLVVVEHRDVELGPQSPLDLEAPRGGDVLEVDAAEPGGDRLHDRDDLVRVLGVEAERPRVDAAELLEQERLALHHRHRRLGADVAEAQHGGAVGDDGDGVLLARQVPGELPIGGDCLADARDAGRVRHREVVAGLDRDLRLHLDLAAEVHQERAVRDVLDLDALDPANALDDPLEVLRVGGVDRDVAHLDALLDADEVDRPERATGLADRACKPPERAGRVRQPHADGGAERCGHVTHRRITPSAARAAISSGS